MRIGCTTHGKLVGDRAREVFSDQPISLVKSPRWGAGEGGVYQSRFYTDFSLEEAPKLGIFQDRERVGWFSRCSGRHIMEQ